MPLTDAGRNLIASGLATGTISPAYNNGNAYIGVGTNNPATAETDRTKTDLSGSTKTRQGMEAGYPPTVSSNVIQFRSLFGTSAANHAWEEWGVFNHATTGTMLCRRVESFGTKPGTQSWQLTVTITINNP